MAAALATAAAGLLARRLTRPRRGWALGWLLPMTAFVLLGAITATELWRVEQRWPAYAAELTARGHDALAARLAAAVEAMDGVAAAALDAAPAADAGFGRLADAVQGHAGMGVVRYDAGRATAWAGELRVDPAATGAPLGATFTPFYLAVTRQAVRGARRVAVTTVVSAVPPADRVASTLDERAARASGVQGYEFAPLEAPAAAGSRPVVVGRDTLFRARAVPPTPPSVRLAVAERARLGGTVLLALAYGAFLLVLWRRGAGAGQRLLTLAAGVALLGVAPLNELSNASVLFDPAVYFAPLAGPFTASVGALGGTAALAVLAVLAMMRTRARVPRWAGAVGAVAVAAVAPYLLRALAQGIALPPFGVTTRLWLAWEITLFLAATAVLLAGAALGRAALGAGRGLPPWVAPAMAGLTALLAPLLWLPPGRWPAAYALAWVASAGALAVTRRHRQVVLTAAAVAGLGAATVVWGAIARKRVELAARDVAGLSVPDPYARTLLERFGDDLLADDAPSSRASLLRRYAESDLAAAGYTASLVRWSAAGARGDSVLLAPTAAGAPAMQDAIAGARAAAAVGWAVREAVGPLGVELVLAAVHADGSATAVTVPPRTRLVSNDPFAALLGFARPAATDPPYTLVLVPGSAPETTQRWTRLGDELHGDWLVRTSTGPARAHVEVDLRSATALLQRGALVVLLDLVVIFVLWSLNALAEGGPRRWIARRWAGWTRSYRARLTVVLFAFFLVPAVLFVTWSYQRLQGDDRQSRELLVGEALRAAAGQGASIRRFEESESDLTAASTQVGAPLLLYADGVLEAGSDPLYEQLATIGRFLAPEVRLSLGREAEVTASSLAKVGDLPVLVGYRAAGDGSAEGERLVLAAPAPTNERALDRRRGDLGTLVLLATALGLLAALWLSGVAAQELARPINALREAALAIAGGARTVSLGAGEPPREFGPVFAAYRRMAADLSASQALLEAAERRTRAVLRNVASGVVAVTRDGTVILANPRAELLCGALTPGAPFACDGARQLAGRAGAFAAGAADEEEFELDLAGRQLHARLTRLEQGGAVLTLDDVTELARAQRVLAWGEMARQVAHEIKNPLTPIRLGVQHLRRARADGRVDFDRVLDQNVTRILAEIDRLDEIARAFSRYGTAPAERPAGEPVDVAAVVRDVVALERMGEGGVAWATEGADAPAVALAREDELREVLLNVLENARHAGARRVVAALTAAPHEIVIAVRDDGEGIPGDVLPRVFEPHFSTRTSGSGLGLAISRRMVEGWGGSMGVESERGRGTTLRIGLRVAGGAVRDTGHGTRDTRAAGSS